MKKTGLTKLSTLFVLLASLAMATSYSQVTIGSNTKPNAGTLLDIKEYDDSTSLSGGRTAYKGIEMPRVALQAYNKLQMSATEPDLTSTVSTEHIGLLVYNMQETTNVCDTTLYDPNDGTYKGLYKGLYIWDGSMWQYLGKVADDVRTITDDGTEITISYKDEFTSYRYSTFGDAGTWMTDNLATKYLPDGTVLTKNTTSTNTSPQYFTPNNLEITSLLINTYDKQGLLYNWPAAMAGYSCSTANQAQVSGTTSGTSEVETSNNPGTSGTSPYKYMQGICPTGWHIPSDREWNELEKAITEGGDTYSTTTYTTAQKTWNSSWETEGNSFRGFIQGAVMKSTDTVVSTANPTGGTSKPSGNGGFSIPLAGAASSGASSDYGMYANMWTSSSYSTTDVWCRSFSMNDTGVGRTTNSRDLYFSIRCKKDQ